MGTEKLAAILGRALLLLPKGLLVAGWCWFGLAGFPLLFFLSASFLFWAFASLFSGLGIHATSTFAVLGTCLWRLCTGFGGVGPLGLRLLPALCPRIGLLESHHCIGGGGSAPPLRVGEECLIPDCWSLYAGTSVLIDSSLSRMCLIALHAALSAASSLVLPTSPTWFP